MKYEIIGANQKTGKDLTVHVEADTTLAAMDQAHEMGLLVRDVRPLANNVPVIVESMPELRRVREMNIPRASHDQYEIAKPQAMPQIVIHQAAPAAPVIHNHISQRQVIVNDPGGRGNSLALGSVVLGVLALLLCWIPLVSAISLLLGGLGLLMAGVGFLVSLMRRGSGIGFSIVGGAVNAIALTVAFVMSGAAIVTGAALGESVRQSGSAKPRAAMREVAPTPPPETAFERIVRLKTPASDAEVQQWIASGLIAETIDATARQVVVDADDWAEISDDQQLAIAAKLAYRFAAKRGGESEATISDGLGAMLNAFNETQGWR